MRTWRARLAAIVVPLALTLAAWAGAAPALAQQPDQVVDRTLAYRAASSALVSAVDAWTVQEKRWNDALEDHFQARRAGDVQRANASLVRSLDLAQELDVLERRVKDQRAVLSTARGGLMAALGTRIASLNTQVAAARTAADRARATALLRDAENQRSDLESESRVQTVGVTYYPTIQFDTRDTPQTLLGKAQLLRSKAEQSDSILAQVDREIEQIDRDLRRSRNAQSLVSGVERYGDIQVPVGAPNRRPTQGDVLARPDSSGVARPKMTPQERIQDLHLFRGQVEMAKRQFLQRAADFETQARRIG